MIQAFIIMLSVMNGAPTLRERMVGSFRFINCPDQACVDEVVDMAGKSQHVSRVRVFTGDTKITKVCSVPMSQPILDLHFN
jgi:hypothetical protein